MRRWIAAIGSVVALTPFGGGCAPQDGHYADPVAYCAAVGTIDQPDGNYIGTKSPAWLPEALKQAIKAPANLSAQSLQPIVWRCADGAVLACSLALGVPCNERAGTSHIPSPGALSFCRAAPEGAEVPARVEGGASIFVWRCHDGWPHIVGQKDKVDGQGFPARFWFKVAPRNLYSA
jgi:hypothetical protein